MNKPRHEVADIIRLHGKAYRKTYQPPIQVCKVLRALSLCRTAALGGHVEMCKSCGAERISYNSCRNLHCPKCQCVNREKWILAPESKLLPVPYYHIVFTLPICFNELLPKYAKEVYKSLFEAAWQTLQVFAADPKYLGAKTGMVAILHTWGQQLWLHPHLHCIIPAGGIQQASGSTPKAKESTCSPKNVVEYLGRYTHKVAISNHRLLEVNDRTVTFTYKDYKEGKKKAMTISGIEFLRRFSHHVLPFGFVRTRHYGFLTSKNKATELNKAKENLNQPQVGKAKLYLAAGHHRKAWV